MELELVLYRLGQRNRSVLCLDRANIMETVAPKGKEGMACETSHRALVRWVKYAQQQSAKR